MQLWYNVLVTICLFYSKVRDAFGLTMARNVSPASTENEHGRVQGTKVKDPRWLRVDICRDFVAGKCKRSEFQCRFAHPKNDCVSENSKVVVCYDSMKAKCCRDNCKFYHPPFHIKEHLLAFGKYLQQQRLERDKAIEAPSSPTVVESNCAASVTTPNGTIVSGPQEDDCQTEANKESMCNETTSRRYSDHLGRYIYHEPPVYMCEDNTGCVYYSAIPSPNVPCWSSPQLPYYQTFHRPVLGSASFMYQGRTTAAMPVLGQVPYISQPFHPAQYGRGNFVSNDIQYYPISPQVIMIAAPQTGMVTPAWPSGQRQLFVTPGYSAEVNRPNSI